MHKTNIAIIGHLGPKLYCKSMGHLKEDDQMTVATHDDELVHDTLLLQNMVRH